MGTHRMILHSKHHGLLLVIGLVYLTMCPHSYEMTAGVFEYSAIGTKIERLDQKNHRDAHDKKPHAMAEHASSGNTVAAESAHTLCRVYAPPPIIKTNLLASIKLQL
jgi:GTP cyclohydrolase FolE2